MKKAPRPAYLIFTENLEALAVSIAMALVLKFFVVEAYQIPTGSMQPTILGDRATGIKDRVLADKLITMLRPPKRWEVMIFRFPLDERQLYVKRIVGLPGETLEIRGGDVWIDGAIARKPDHINESVLKDVFPGTDGSVDIGRWFAADRGVEVQRDRAIFADGGQPEIAGARPELKLRTVVFDEYLHGYDPQWGIAPPPLQFRHAVSDLDVRLSVTPGSRADALRIVLESDEGDTVFVLPTTNSGETARVELGDDGRTVPVEGGRTLTPGETVEVAARSVDRRIVLSVDGEEWLRFDDDESGPRSATPQRAGLRLSLDGGGVVEDVSLRRDIFYTPGWFARGVPTPGRWEIPEGKYFGLGDNTQSSHDGRSWQTRTLELSDGRKITGFDFDLRTAPDANPRRLPNGKWLFSDLHGDAIEISPNEIVKDYGEPAPFIDERYLLGKAVVVFWPVVNPFRWKLIR